MDRSTTGLTLSVTLHGTVIAVLLLLSYVFNSSAKPMPTVLELVAGEGDDYRATHAPALGTEGAIKVDLPPPPKSEPAPPPAPVVTVEKAPTPKAEQPIPNLAKTVQRQLRQSESKAKAIVARERAAREKAERERMTKEAFDRANRAKTTDAKTPPPKVAKIDGAGIARGVLGGSVTSKAGAGGKALTVAERSEIEGYIAMLQQRLKDELDRTPNLDDGLVAEAELHILADGRLTRARITRSSGDDTFDNAVLHAISVVRMPDRPKGLEEVQIVPFATRAKQ